MSEHLRPLQSIRTEELELELELREGPTYQCRSCRALLSSHIPRRCCPHCGTLDCLSAIFDHDESSPEWRAWEASLVATYRGTPGGRLHG